MRADERESIVSQVDTITRQTESRQKDHRTDESMLHSINSTLTDFGSIIRKINRIYTAADDDIPARRTFI